jgi:hypothetical protein
MDIARETIDHTPKSYLHRTFPVSLEGVVLLAGLALGLIVLTWLGGRMRRPRRRDRRR